MLRDINKSEHFNHYFLFKIMDIIKHTIYF